MTIGKIAKPLLSAGSAKHKRNTKHAGEVAELEFMVRAARRNLNVLKPYGDNQRYDCLVESGSKCSRVQIKSTNNIVSRGLLHVNCGRRASHGPTPYLPSEVDFLAIHVIPENSFYIIPIEKVFPRISLLIYPRTHRKPGVFGDYYEAWHLLE